MNTNRVLHQPVELPVQDMLHLKAELRARLEQEDDLDPVAAAEWVVRVAGIEDRALALMTDAERADYSRRVTA